MRVSSSIPGLQSADALFYVMTAPAGDAAGHSGRRAASSRAIAGEYA